MREHTFIIRGTIVFLCPYTCFVIISFINIIYLFIKIHLLYLNIIIIISLLLTNYILKFIYTIIFLNRPEIRYVSENPHKPVKCVMRATGH